MKKDNIKCVLTLDYELFFKQSGTAQASIIYPTQELIRVLDKVNGKATFFVDALYLDKLKYTGGKHINTYTQIESQLLNLVSNNHRIELHLHPHWIDAYWDDKTSAWIFPSYRHYKLNSLTENEIIDIFIKTVALLNNIARKVDKDYSVMAFRAGGWEVEPFSKIKKAMIQSGIFIDSSVLPGAKYRGEVHDLNYIDIQKTSWFQFTEDIGEQVENGIFTEIPVNSYVINSIEKIVKYVKRKINKQEALIYGDGIGIPLVKNNGLLSKIRSLKSFQTQEQFSLDGYVDSSLFCKKASKSNLNFLTIVSHPKTLTPSSLRTIIELSDKRFRFITIQDIYQEIIDESKI
jgi:hypothetical protein